MNILNTDSLNSILYYCDVTTSSLFGATCKRINSIATIDLGSITFKYALKNNSKSILDYLLESNYKFDHKKYINQILKSNNYTLIKKYISPLDNYDENITKTILDFVTDELSIIHIYSKHSNKMFYYNLICLDRIDIINNLIKTKEHENLDTVINNSFSECTSNFDHKIKSMSFAMAKFLYEHDIILEYYFIKYSILSNDLNYVKWIFTKLGKKVIARWYYGIKNLYPIESIDICKWLYEEDYIAEEVGNFLLENNCTEIISTSLDPFNPSIQLIIYCAKNKRFDISDTFLNYYGCYGMKNFVEVCQIAYYYVKAGNMSILSHSNFSKCNIDNIETICTLSNDKCIYNYLEYNNKGNFLKFEINDIIKNDNMKVANLLFCHLAIEHNEQHGVLKKVLKTNKRKLFDLAIKSYNFKNINNSRNRFIFNNPDDSFHDYILPYICDITQDTLIYIIKNSPMPTLRFIIPKLILYANEKIMKNVLKYRNLEILNMFLLMNCELPKYAAYCAYKNSIAAAEYILLKQSFSITTICPFPVYNSYYLKESLVNEMNAINEFSTWLISKNPDISNCSLSDCVKQNNIVFFRYLLTKHRFQITNYDITSIISKPKFFAKLFLKYLVSVNLLINPFCVYQKLIVNSNNRDKIFDRNPMVMMNKINLHNCIYTNTTYISSEKLNVFIKLYSSESYYAENFDPYKQYHFKTHGGCVYR